MLNLGFVAFSDGRFGSNMYIFAKSNCKSVATYQGAGVGVNIVNWINQTHVCVDYLCPNVIDTMLKKVAATLSNVSNIDMNPPECVKSFIEWV